jgi:hypothetical protein
MRDYMYQIDGAEVPIAKMALGDVQRCLSQGFDIVGDEDKRHNIVERLKIELLIRGMGL